MTTSINLIENWSKAFALPVNTQFVLPSEIDFEAHCKHIVEEGNELLKAFKECNREQILDGIGDLFWVTVRLNMLLGIPAHKHFYHKVFYSNGVSFDDLEEDIIRGYIKTIQERLELVIGEFNCMDLSRTLHKGNVKITPRDIGDFECALWGLNVYVVALIEYLGVDLDKLISIIYESNISFASQ